MTELEKQLCDALKHISSAIERQLELIAERAPGQFLDKRPVVQALGSHARRANAAIAAAEAAQAVKSEPVAWMCEEMVDGELEREFNGHNEFSGGRTGVPLYAAPQPASAQPATVPDDARECLLDVVSHHQAFVDACRFTLLHVHGENVLYWKHQADVLDRMKGQAERALATAPAQVEQQSPDKWQPIGTAPADGRTILLGYFNSHGNWRTLRGQWVTKERINEEWEDADFFEAGWYETSVEADDAPSFWPTKPTHWQPLPAAPTQEAGARLAAEAKGGSDANH